MQEPLVLPLRSVVELCPSAPFNFDATLHKPDHFPSADNIWEPGTRWQTMLWQGQPLGLKFEDHGTASRPNIALSIYSHTELDRVFRQNLIDEITHRYRLQLDLQPFNQRFADDPQLGPVMRRWRGMRPMNPGSLYEYLMVAIVLQNATVRRSVKMLQALFENYGTLLVYDGKRLFSYWVPAVVDQATEGELRQLKVGYRAKSIKRVTSAIVRKEIDELALRSQPSEKQRQALLGLYGIGPASVGYLLTDVFGQLDEMGHISPWEQKIYSKLFFNRDPEEPVPVSELQAFFNAHYSGYRALAVHYFWEDLFWKRKHAPVPWLEELIRV